MRRTLSIVVAVAALAIAILLLTNQEQVPAVSAPLAQEQLTDSATPQEALLSDAPTISRELVATPTPPAVDQKEEEKLVSPLEALATYSLDLHETARTGDLADLLAATGLHLNHPAMRSEVGKRWGYSEHHNFPEAPTLGNVLYPYWLERMNLDQRPLRDALLDLFWSEKHLDIWKHWVSLVIFHNQEGDQEHIISELHRYLDTYDRTKPDCAARIAVLHAWLMVHSAFGPAELHSLCTLLTDEQIGKAVGDAFGFNLCHLVNRLPYTAIAHQIPALLAHASPEVQWGTVELLRQYVDRQQLNGEAMAGMIPDALIRHLDQTRCAAALELLASFGGQNGKERILDVVRDQSSPRRAAALGFLAAAGRIDVPEILSFASEPRLAMPVVGALGSLGSRGNDQALTELRTFLSHENADVRHEAALLLFRAGRLSAEEASRHGVTG